MLFIYYDHIIIHLFLFLLTLLCNKKGGYSVYYANILFYLLISNIYYIYRITIQQNMLFYK